MVLPVVAGGIAFLFVVFLVIQRTGWISLNRARNLVRQGACVIDVRGATEYQRRHLNGALNIPGNRLAVEIRRYAPDPEAPVLVHCLTGGRSGLAVRTLRRMGYVHVYNLGGYGRAARILQAVRQTVDEL
jgi:phage shock protein E